ncbi:outer membrane protein [Helicobacter salomonis]|uniref:outer membrane protein n=1 Tax=Helicobacter salomonis TaxID=56878 RepID=UPI000CF1A760|nr:outer membrane protein [Helicobacter salomonis]
MRIKSLVALSLVSLLSANDGSGIFIGGGYQQGKAQIRMQDKGVSTELTTPLKGFGIQIGYQMFPSKFFGLKLYGFFDYAHAQGIEFAAKKNASGGPLVCQAPAIKPPAAPPGMPPGVPPTIPPLPSVGLPNCQLNVMGILQELVGNNKPIAPNMLTYGAGADIVLNVINNKAMALGAVGGIQFAGNSWILATPDFAHVALEFAGLDKKATAFQFLFNVGGRVRLLKHSSIEAGIKFPMIKGNPFLQTKNDGNLYIRRLYSWYVNYTFTF